MADNLWLSLAFLAASIYATLSLFDKVVLDRNPLGPLGTTAISGGSMMAVFIIIGIMTNNVGVETLSPSLAVLSVMGIAMFGGVLYVTSLWTYFIGLGKTDVSRFVPLLSLDLIIVLPFGYLLFNEQLNIFVYAGVFAIFFGTILISLDDISTGIKLYSPQALFWGLAVAIPGAGYTLVLEFMTNHMTIFAIMLWVGVGGVLSLAVLLVWKGRDLEQNPTAKLKSVFGLHGSVMSVRGAFIAIAFYAFVSALQSGPVSIAIAILKLDVFLVFFGVLVLSKVAPEVLYERMDLTILTQKFVASGFIVAGVVVIQTFN